MFAAAAALIIPSTLAAAPILAPPPPHFGPGVQPFVSVAPGQIALTHVRVIDGTGAAPVEDATILIDGAKIAAVQPAAAAIAPGYRVIDGSGETVSPASSGCTITCSTSPVPTSMRPALFEDLRLLPQMTFSAPRLYLANGVTTMRTTGSVEPYADLNVKARSTAARWSVRTWT